MKKLSILLFSLVLGCHPHPDKTTEREQKEVFRLNSDCEAETKRFLSELQSCMKSEDLQQWAVKAIENSDQARSRVDLTVEMLPKALRDFVRKEPKPMGMAVIRNEHGPYVSLVWNDGRDLYGVWAGPLELGFPASMGYSIRSSPGVYVWHSRN